MTTDKALKLALEALEPLVRRAAPWGELDWLNGCKAIIAIKEALAQPEQGICAGGCPPETQIAYKAAIKLADWLSAALDDPKVCNEYKRDINAWFDAAMPYPVFVFDPALAQDEPKCVACEGRPNGDNDPCSVCGLAQPEQEPVEDVVEYHSDGTMTVRISPKRPLVWLTWDDIPEADVGNQDFRRGAMWAVDFFKEKNT